MLYILGEGLFVSAAEFLYAYIAHGVEFDLRKRLLDSIINAPSSFFDKTPLETI